MRRPGSIAHALLACLAVLAAAPPDRAQDRPSGPPLEGDALTQLLGRHRASNEVRAMVNWAGLRLESEDVGLARHEHYQRATFVYEDEVLTRLEVYANESGRIGFTGALPFGLTRSTTQDEIEANGDWSEGSGYLEYRTGIAMDLGAVRLLGMTGSVAFTNARTLRYVGLSIDHEPYLRSLRDAYRDMAPASSFDPSGWPSIVGSDAANDPGWFLMVWSNAVGSDAGFHAGLRLGFERKRYLSTAAFRHDYRGSFPFGLASFPDAAALEALFGPPTGVVELEEPRTKWYWQLGLVDSPPLYVGLERPPSADDFSRLTPELVLSRSRQRVERWNELTRETTEEANRFVVRDIGALWRTAIVDPLRLCGASEVTEGLFGQVERFRSRWLLWDVLGGTITGPTAPDLAPTYRIEYPLRLRARTDDGREALLEPWIEPMSKVVGAEYVAELVSDDPPQPLSMVWRRAGESFLDDGPSLAIEVRRSAALQDGTRPDGFDVVLQIDAPVPTQESTEDGPHDPREEDADARDGSGGPGGGA